MVILYWTQFFGVNAFVYLVACVYVNLFEVRLVAGGRLILGVVTVVSARGAVVDAVGSMLIVEVVVAVGLPYAVVAGSGRHEGAW